MSAEADMLPFAALLLACGAGGVLAGLVYFRSVWRTAQRLAQGGGTGAALAHAALRLGLLGAGLMLAALAGLLPLLAATLGVLGGRVIALRRWGREGP